MNRREPRAVGELLVTALPQLEDRLLVQRLRRTWASLVGAEMARRAQPQALVKGCLQIVVDNSPWLHELTLRAPDLAGRLGAEYPAVRSGRRCDFRPGTGGRGPPPPGAGLATGTGTR